jgi:hypothetical protein
VTLHDALNNVRILLDSCKSVVIARGHDEPFDGRSSAFQIRFLPLTADIFGCWCETRSWLGGQWSSWREQRGWLGGAGFDIRDVLATDWRVLDQGVV